MPQIALELKELDPSKPYDGLTAKQWDYCYARAAGLDMIAAYKSAYDVTGDSRSSWHGNAHTLEQDHRVTAKIKSLVDKKYGETNLVPIQVTREFVVNGIVGIAKSKDAKPNVQLRAYELLGKMAGIDLFRDVVVHDNRKRTLEEIDTELERHLGKLLEGRARDVTPEPADSLPAGYELGADQAEGEQIEGEEQKAEQVEGVNLDPVNVAPANPLALENAGDLPDDMHKPLRDRRRKPIS